MSAEQERRYLNSQARCDGGEYRVSSAVRVATLVRLAAAGHPVPVSGDATLRWIGGE